MFSSGLDHVKDELAARARAARAAARGDELLRAGDASGAADAYSSCDSAGDRQFKSTSHFAPGQLLHGGSGGCGAPSPVRTWRLSFVWLV